ncbi:MAG TPA: metal-dependent hydrolase [Noviherbaspirillum sp.]|nr:metal-dependent hydrolase [Noviherbaspirillum sp.]
MDNLTHSVAGLAVGELVHRSLRQETDSDHQKTRHRLLLVTCWAASSFPDLDLVLTSLLPAPLGYLLHHRGHTHTLLYAIPQALFLWALIWVLWPAARRLLKESASARSGFLLAGIIGFTLHMLMDYLNSYGIHPFHPFDSRWLYGDMVFIIEPMFWILLGVPLAMMVPSVLLRALILVSLVGAQVFFSLKGFLAPGSLAVLIAAAVLLAVLQHKAGPSSRRGLFVALMLSVGFVGVQGAASRHGSNVIAATLHKLDPDSRVLDSAMTSFPTNPLCWSFVSVESNEGAGTYRLRRGILSIAPRVVPASGCPATLAEHVQQDATSPAIAFVLEEQGSLAQLRRLKDENCHFAAWMRFARAPSVTENEASDIRFRSTLRKNFTTITFAEFSDRECPQQVPQWDFPRSDLLTPQGSASH